MRTLGRLTLLQKLLLVVFGAALLTVVSSTGTVHAADEVQNQIVNCGDGSGVNTYNEHDYAGMIVEMQWKRSGSSTTYDAKGTWAVVSTILPTSSNGGNLYNAGNNSRAYQGTFSQMNNRCGRASVAVFGYGSTSQRRTSDGNWTAGPWALDCDVSFHGRGNEQRFNVTGEGVPDGAKPGGSWNTVEMRSRNGYTKLVTVTYTEPPQNWDLNVTTQIQTDKGGWTKNDIGRKAGDLVKFRYVVDNDSQADTTKFDRWREVNYESDRTIKQSPKTKRPTAQSDFRDGDHNPNAQLDKGKSVTDELSFRIPDNAQTNWLYCHRAKVNPKNSGSGGVLTSNTVCVKVVAAGICPPYPPGKDTCDEADPSWALSVNSWVGGNPAQKNTYIEPSGTVTFNHSITNTDPNNKGGKVAKGFTRCPVFNYDPGDSNAGIGGDRCGISRQANISPGYNPITDNESSVLYANGDTRRGTTYCQRYSVGRQSESNPTPLTSNPPACAIVVGGTSSLRTNVQDNVTQIEPGESANLTATISTRDFSGGNEWPGYTVNCSYNVTANGAVVEVGGCSQNIGGNGETVVKSWGRNPAQEGDLGQLYCLNVSADTTNPFFWEGLKTSSSCFRVIARPYFKAYGGDVAAGCAGNSSTIVGWNKNGAGGTFNGAGGSLAVFAQGVIRGFASGQTVPSGNSFGTGPTNLSFANAEGSSVSVGGGIINGGAFGGNLDAGNCKSDYLASMPTGSDIVNGWPGVNEANRAPVQNFYVQGNIDMTSVAGEVPTVTQNSRIRLYVKGDVFISKDILPSTAPNDAIEKVPSITVVARNIYISPNVGQLYGTYVAQQDSAGGGNIYTCASGIGSPLTVQGGGNPSYNACKQKQLVFTGSVVAKKIHLLRTWGSLYQDGGGASPTRWGGPGGPGYNAAGEVFRFNPLVWQRESTGGPETGTVKLYDSITSPPASL